MSLAIRTCPVCSRDFITNKCTRHCGPECCRRDPVTCPNRAVATRRMSSKFRKCVVCGRSNIRFPFEAFAACDSNCNRVFYGSSRSDPGRSIVSRKWLCYGAVNNLAPPWDSYHRPAAKPRVHIKYCSLRCYTNTERGHDARARNGQAERSFRYWSKRGNRHAILKEARRQRMLKAPADLLTRLANDIRASTQTQQPL